jgi:hypothetical protein
MKQSVIFFICLFHSLFSLAQCDDFTQEIIANNPTCYGFSDGSVTLEVEGETGDVYYSIKNTEGIELTVGDNNYADLLSGGWYYTYVQDDLGCEIEDSVLIGNDGPMNLSYVVNPSSNDVDCNGYVVIDTVINYNGEYDFISYFWAPLPDGVYNGYEADSCFNMCSGLYFLTVNDENGCSTVREIYVGYVAGVETINDLEVNLTVLDRKLIVQLSQYTQPLTIEIYALNGALTKVLTLNGSVTEIPDFSVGNYVYTIKSSEKIVSKGQFAVQ